MPVGNWLIWLLFYSPLRKISFRKWSPLRHWVFPKYTKRTLAKHPETINDTVEVDSWRPFYLPPTEVADTDQARKLKMIEDSGDSAAYVTGWMYRNPIGMEKYRADIMTAIKPKKKVRTHVSSVLAYPRANFKHVVGVHFRLGDYRYVEEKKFFFEPQQVEKILTEYVTQSGMQTQDICFVICSDEKLNPDHFKSINAFFPTGSPAEDLFTLAATDVIIGSDSTFGPFAAWYGNVPFIIFDRTGIDWEYYKGKEKFFVTTKPNRVFY